MYLPKHFEETDIKVLHSLVRAHPLGSWVTVGSGGLIANHIPFLLKEGKGDLGTLVGHLARANDAWRTFSPSISSLVIFQGADSYITPSLYPGKKEHGKVVPTWNYAVVHIRGIPCVHDDRDWLVEHLAELTSAHEKGEEVPWKPSDAPADFIGRMVEGIVGIEIPIGEITGKWKIGQNRTVNDQMAAAQGLRAKGNPLTAPVADMMEASARKRSP